MNMFMWSVIATDISFFNWSLDAVICKILITVDLSLMACRPIGTEPLPDLVTTYPKIEHLYYFTYNNCFTSSWFQWVNPALRYIEWIVRDQHHLWTEGSRLPLSGIHNLRTNFIMLVDVEYILLRPIQCLLPTEMGNNYDNYIYQKIQIQTYSSYHLRYRIYWWAQCHIGVENIVLS